MFSMLLETQCSIVKPIAITQVLAEEFWVNLSARKLCGTRPPAGDEGGDWEGMVAATKNDLLPLKLHGQYFDPAYGPGLG